MNSIAIIVTWFGKLPCYFPIWLRSAEYNKDIDFFIFSDQYIETKAANIFFYKTTLKYEIRRMYRAIGKRITIDNAYKFCDLRPFFGLGYHSFIKNYQWWGYCDIDMVFGNLSHFITDRMLSRYERIYNYGHLSLFKNNDRINNMIFMRGGIYTLSEILRGKAKCTPEEEYGLNRICRKNHIIWYDKADYADFYIPYDTLILNNNRNYKYQVFYWEDGCVYRAYLKNGVVCRDEFVYAHWQKRNPVVANENAGFDSFFITSQSIIKKEKGLPTVKQIKEMNPPLTIERKNKQDKKYLYNKRKQFLKCSLQQKLIWMRQKAFFLMDNGKLVESRL